MYKKFSISEISEVGVITGAIIAKDGRHIGYRANYETTAGGLRKPTPEELEKYFNIKE